MQELKCCLADCRGNVYTSLNTDDANDLTSYVSFAQLDPEFASMVRHVRLSKKTLSCCLNDSFEMAHILDSTHHLMVKKKPHHGAVPVEKWQVYAEIG